MSEKHENIEDFVRKVVDQSEAQIPFNESHWQQMESMLEAELPVVSNPGTGYYYFSNIVSLLVGAVFVWLWFTDSGTADSQIIADRNAEIVESPKEAFVSENSSANRNIEVQPSTSTINETVEGDKMAPSRNEEPEQSTLNAVTSSSDELHATEIETQNVESVTENLNSRPGHSETSEKEVSATREASTPDAQTEADLTDAETVQTSSVRPVARINDEEARISTTDERKVVTINKEEETIEEVYNALSGLGIDYRGAIPEFPDELVKVEVFEPDGGSYDHTETSIVNGSTRGPFSRFSVGISLAPDLSSNHLFRYNRLGRDLGIVVDYWITPRLSVSAGVFNTSKRYLVGGEEYSPPAGFWGNITNGELPAKIDAKCQVLDIPINLKYQLFSGAKFNIAASAGVSSYIMLKEDYRYELDNGWESEWGTRNENQHFFGVGNLQVHFERRFGKHFAFEVAPFFKVPLTSYGHGNIRFHSMGSFFTLRKYFLTR